ncbi:MraY family glycosyltransferase [Chitinasiproducens palmae]|uniref:UDP-N-acetylmuramyl pentapeptide phosphotransferase/UDP-N-acetylglucosamine-1-phosphate transferase n=1 Tax=Chitinasiproducens palmae TaxID=1770053 RepID=A0A1H2PMN1_9BURK|nr:glycosyltransferase [Chitinasiproducens palmae]SDV47815.1 UDP-N-acetylmuramyl pentapeptide phosphotransferase/UDP-N-acetylglucosamine-1-phosphate transferase [Chitinasiproducens palmae]
MQSLALGFLISLLATLAIVRYAHLHKRFSADSDLVGVQKFHSRPVPRVGGIGIVLGLLVSAAQLWFSYPVVAQQILLLAACGAPAFLSGLIEDLTKRVSPLLRLLATMAAALLAYLALGIHANRADLPFLDIALQYAAPSVLLTVVAVAGLANAVNIIDGFNGLASMVSMMMLVSLAYVAFQVSDPVVLSSSLILMGAVFGFFVWNFPAGLIFLGDGGAYFLGFVLGELSILLVMRNPQVSAWYPVLMAMYPIFETCFSIYRKRFVRGMSPGIPDGVHLHMLVYKRLMRWAVGTREASALTQRNSYTSPYLWMLCLMAVLPATLFWRHTVVLVFFVAIFAATYVWLYVSIVRFRTPRWMVIRRHDRQ